MVVPEVWYTLITSYSLVLTSFWRRCPGTEKFLGGSTRSLAYTDHIIQFGLNKFLASLLGIEKFLGGSTKSLTYTDHIIQFGLNSRHNTTLIIK